MPIFQELQTTSKNLDFAIADLKSQIAEKERNFSVLFFSNHYNKIEIEEKLKELSKNMIAVSTAGEIALGRYHEHTIAGLSFDFKYCEATPFLIENIFDLEKSNLIALVDMVAQIKERKAESRSNSKTICLLFVDGLSGSEERLTETLDDILTDIPIVGGSNGDGMEFKSTTMLFNGQSYKNAAVLLFITTEIPFEVIKTQHFDASENKVVITEAIPEKRIVLEMNGIRAVDAYAELLKVPVEELNAQVFSKFPLALKVGDKCYLRSIRNVNPDGSLTLYSAIEVGIVLSIATRRDIAEITEEDLTALKMKLGTETKCILFECILRRLEVLDSDQKMKDRLFALYKTVNAVGFHTYGEQSGNLHINQTLIGVMFGK